MQKFSKYRAHTDLVDSIISRIPNLRFFDKDGYSIESTLVSAITFTYTEGDYKCDGLLSLFRKRAPELIIQNRQGSYLDIYSSPETTVNKLLVLENVINGKVFHVPDSYIDEISLYESDVTISGKTVSKKDIASISLTSEILESIVFKDFIGDLKAPCIKWDANIETEKTSVEFISSDVINILEYKPEDDTYITPLSDLKLPVLSDTDESLNPKDLLVSKESPYIEIPSMMMSTLQSDENFIIQVDYKKERLDKVPYKTINPIYSDKDDLDIKGHTSYIKELLEKTDLKLEPRFTRYFKDVDNIWTSRLFDENNEYLRKPKYKPVDLPIGFHIGISSEDPGAFSNIFDLYVAIERIPLKDVEILESEYQYMTYLVNIGRVESYTDIVGYDDRYRTFFTNFGLPDPIEYGTIFKDISPYENEQNADVVNKKSKELFLAYKDIFPYKGTYKALLNAVKFLGYDDLYFREWYKSNDIANANKVENLTYVGLDVKEGLTLDDKLKSVNIDFETYINLIKLNRLSMAYKINRESGEVDSFGVPQVEEVYDYKNADVLVKLYSVKEWLERHIIGVNCQITDLTGEGIYFQRFESIGYPNSIENFDVEAHFNLTPAPVNQEYAKVLKDETLSADINLTLLEYENTTIDDISDRRISDFVKFVVDLTPVRLDGESVVPVTEDPYYRLKDENGYFNLLTQIFEKRNEWYGPGDLSFTALNKDVSNRNMSVLDPKIDMWDVNNIFHVPVSVPVSAPIIYDNITYNLENVTANGSIYNSLTKSPIFQNQYPEILDQGVLADTFKPNRFQYLGSTFEFDKTKTKLEGGSFVNSIILDNNELELLDHTYSKVDFKYLPSFRIKSGKIRQLGRSISESSLFTIDTVVTDNGDIRYGMKSDNYSDRPYEKYITGAEKNQKFTLDKDVILSNDYYSFVPDYSKNPECRFEFLQELDSYAFVVKDYKIQFNDTKAIYDMTLVSNRGDFNIREEFKTKLNSFDEFIIDIYDGTLTSEVRDPLRDNIHLTEELDYRSTGTGNSKKELIYRYVKYNVPVTEITGGISNLVKSLYDEIFKLGSTKNIQELVANNEIENLIRDESTSVATQINNVIESIKETKKYRDINSYTKTRYTRSYSKIDAFIADRIQDRVSSSIKVNSQITIPVNHTGDYKYEAHAYDKFNTVYRAECKWPISVSKKLDEIWVGTEYHNQDIEDKTQTLIELLSNNYSVPSADYNPLVKYAQLTNLKSENAKNKHFLAFNFFDLGFNKYPRFEKLERYKGLTSILISDKTAVQYQTRPYELDGNFLSFSNVTDSAYDAIHMFDSSSPINSQPSYIEKNKNVKDDDDKIGEHILTFKMSLDNIYTNNLYDIGTRLNCVIYDEYNHQYLGTFNNLVVNSLKSFYDSNLKAHRLELVTSILTESEGQYSSEFKRLAEMDKNPHIRFYFIKAHQYQIVNYINDYDNRTCDVKIRVNKSGDTEFNNLKFNNFKFNPNDIIKIRSTRVRFCRVVSQADESISVIETIPAYTEVAYRIVKLSPYSYEYEDAEGTITKITDDEYQIVTLDGLMDPNTNARIAYRADLFGSQSNLQDKLDEKIKTKLEKPAYIPNLDYTELSDLEREQILTDYHKVIESGIMNERERTIAFKEFILKWFNKGKKQPGSPIYFMRNMPGTTPESKLIVFIDKRSGGTPDWFIESILYEDSKITDVQSFVNRLLDKTEPVDLTMGLAHTDYVAYPFIGLEQAVRKDRTDLVVDDPYSIFKYIDGNFSFISNDFDIETAYRDWVNPEEYYKYNMRFFNGPVKVSNKSDYILTKTSDSNWRTLNKWSIFQNDNTLRYLLYRLRNNNVFLRSNIDNAVYDIELESIDEYGNKVKTIKNAAIRSV